MTGHLSRCFLAGIVALLPIGGLVLAVAYTESFLRSSLFRESPFYFPGLGLLAVTVAIYLIGLSVTSFLGQWLWRIVDKLFDNLPALGPIYRTLKQILGYGEGKEALFHRVVWVPSRDTAGVQLGLVTQELEDGRLVVFVPGSPNPTTGRLLGVESGAALPVSKHVNDAFKALVSVGKTAMPVE
jgi:uncharacterized membrane protein